MIRMGKRNKFSKPLKVFLICAMLESCGLGCVLADLFWVPRKTAAYIMLFTLALMLNVLLGVFLFMNIIKPLIILDRLLNQSEENTESKDYILENVPQHGVFMEDIMRLSSMIHARREREHMLEALKKEAELNSLRSQINPHFLYNTLDSIRGQLMGLGFSEPADNIESLSKLFRYSINPKTVYNTLEQELNNVEDYMHIMRFRLGDRLAFETIIDPENDCILNCELPKLTLQPIVENAIQHGLEGMSHGGRISIRAYAEQDGLTIWVSDNGRGIDEKRLEELNKRFRDGSPVMDANGTGIALVNVNERIRLLYGGRPYGLYVCSAPGKGTQVRILLPMRLVPAVQSGSVIDWGSAR